MKKTQGVIQWLFGTLKEGQIRKPNTGNAARFRSTQCRQRRLLVAGTGSYQEVPNRGIKRLRVTVPVITRG